MNNKILLMCIISGVYGKGLHGNIYLRKTNQHSLNQSRNSKSETHWTSLNESRTASSLAPVMAGSAAGLLFILGLVAIDGHKNPEKYMSLLASPYENNIFLSRGVKGAANEARVSNQKSIKRNATNQEDRLNNSQQLSIVPAYKDTNGIFPAGRQLIVNAGFQGFAFFMRKNLSGINMATRAFENSLTEDGRITYGEDIAFNKLVVTLSLWFLNHEQYQHLPNVISTFFNDISANAGAQITNIHAYGDNAAILPLTWKKYMSRAAGASVQSILSQFVRQQIDLADGFNAIVPHVKSFYVTVSKGNMQVNRRGNTSLMNWTQRGLDCLKDDTMQEILPDLHIITNNLLDGASLLLNDMHSVNSPTHSHSYSTWNYYMNDYAIQNTLVVAAPIFRADIVMLAGFFSGRNTDLNWSNIQSILEEQGVTLFQEYIKHVSKNPNSHNAVKALHVRNQVVANTRLDMTDAVSMLGIIYGVGEYMTLESKQDKSNIVNYYGARVWETISEVVTPKQVLEGLETFYQSDLDIPTQIVGGVYGSAEVLSLLGRKEDAGILMHYGSRAVNSVLSKTTPDSLLNKLRYVQGKVQSMIDMVNPLVIEDEKVIIANNTELDIKHLFAIHEGKLALTSNGLVLIKENSNVLETGNGDVLKNIQLTPLVFIKNSEIIVSDNGIDFLARHTMTFAAIVTSFMPVLFYIIIPMIQILINSVFLFASFLISIPMLHLFVWDVYQAEHFAWNNSAKLDVFFNNDVPQKLKPVFRVIDNAEQSVSNTSASVIKHVANAKSSYRSSVFSYFTSSIFSSEPDVML